MMQLRLNPDIDWERVTTEYQQDKRTRIDQVLVQSDAELLHDYLNKKAVYNLAFTQNEQNAELTEKEFLALGRAEIQRIQMHMHEQASRGIGFCYSRLLATKDLNTENPVKALHALLNTDEVKQKFAMVTGSEPFKFVSSQATKYAKGQYLTRHNDINPAEGRAVAYVIGLTPQWHPDWGGLLQFYYPDGRTRDAWEPRFNSISLFDVSHVHAVTFVTPFALKNRYSVTGWFRYNK
jgi:SM-20-related protein